jgi:hypothetical protein
MTSGLVINAALCLALVGKSPTAAFVGEPGEQWLLPAGFVTSGSILPLARMLARAHAFGKGGIADSRISAAPPRC